MFMDSTMLKLNRTPVRSLLEPASYSRTLIVSCLRLTADSCVATPDPHLPLRENERKGWGWGWGVHRHPARLVFAHFLLVPPFDWRLDPSVVFLVSSSAADITRPRPTHALQQASDEAWRSRYTNAEASWLEGQLAGGEEYVSAMPSSPTPRPPCLPAYALPTTTVCTMC